MRHRLNNHCVRMSALHRCCYCCLVALSVIAVICSLDSEDYYNVSQIGTKIQQGVELAVFENALHQLQASYKLEDFFWTGSGDGELSHEDHYPTEEESSSEDYSTIYTTKPVFVTPIPTIYPTPSTTTCHSCETSTDDPEQENGMNADKEFWLLTVLKTHGKDPDVVELRRSLTNLYRKAFQRQQAKHLGIQPRIKRQTKPISVYIHKMDRQPMNGDEKMEVIYHVAVAGQPVDATTAAEDMRLVTDSEVKEELGFPFIVKAEPYIKPTVAQEIAEVKSTWLFVSISLIILIALIVGVLLIAFCMTNRKRDVSNASVCNEDKGRVNESYVQDGGYTNGRRKQQPSPTYINFRSQPSNETLHSLRPTSALSSSTQSSNGSIDISPLMEMNKTRKMQRPKAALNKTAPMDMRQLAHSTSSSSSTLSDAICIDRNRDPGVTSPKSYLSMPSVKSFPKGNNPEPLNKVLEPLSVHHLDMLEDELPMKRCGSLGAGEDPGVIGPVVWNLHKHRMHRGTSFDDDMDDAHPANVSKMRKRFHELLDDTFSLFGSRRESPHRRQIHVKSSSDMETRPGAIGGQRPKTTEFRRYSEVPKGAWMSSAPSPLIRPISAPFERPFTAVPQINRGLILVDGTLPQDDPAIPLIAEIKKEIGKCSSDVINK